jgi:small subunit ribosomal protein S3
MGQKVHPHGLRVGIIKDWDARWIAKKGNFADYIVEDDKIRKFLKKKLYAAGISKIEIERAANKISVSIYTGKPGIVIGKGGTGVDVLKQDLLKLTGKNIVVNIIEVKRPDLDAQLVAENVAAQLEKRISFRRAMKQSIGRCMKNGAKGVKIKCSGRLGGAEIARNEQYHEGSIPLQTLRADID